MTRGSDGEDDGFLARWSRRKAGQRQPPALAPVAPAPPPALLPDPHPTPAASRVKAAPGERGGTPATAPPAPTIEDVARLTPQSDFRRYVAADVEAGVRNAALKKLFADPHFNVMDGLDVYIEDYGAPDPLPAAWLRKMTNSGLLRAPEPERPVGAPAAGPADTADLAGPAAGAAPAPLPPDDAGGAAPSHPSPDEDPDLRLQPHDAAGRPGADAGAGQDAAGQH